MQAARIGPMLARLGIEPENRIALVLLDTVDFSAAVLGSQSGQALFRS